MKRLRFGTLIRPALLAIAAAFVSAAGSPPPNEAAVTPPLPPSPVALFRQMLNTNDVGRAEALAQRPESHRKLLEAKLREYDALNPEDRKQRLRATEFLWYLRPVLTSPPAARLSQLQSIPESYRDAIAERVARWDGLPQQTRQDLLAYDHALNWLSQNRLLSTRRTPQPPPTPPGLVATRLENELSRWQALPEPRRLDLCRQFESFFHLGPSERRRALQELLPEDQKQMEATLEAFNRLPRAQRALCIASFRKFASLSSSDRADFLRSATRWREMSPEEREQWRRLVTTLPPLPPGFDSPPPLPPPTLPPPPSPRRSLARNALHP